MDNYPVLCTVKYQDRRMSLTYRLRIKPVFMKFSTCKNASCYLHMTPSTWRDKCRACRSAMDAPQEKMLFKIYTSSSTDIVDVVAILRKVLWMKQSRFRKPQTRWLSSEVFMFKQSYETAKEWFDANRATTVKDGFEKKLKVSWEKEMPSHEALLALYERRRLLKEL